MNQVLDTAGIRSGNSATVKLKTAVHVVTVLSAVACLFAFAAGGLRAYFTGDDVLNLLLRLVGLPQANS